MIEGGCEKGLKLQNEAIIKDIEGFILVVTFKVKPSIGGHYSFLDEFARLIICCRSFFFLPVAFSSSATLDL